MNKAIAKNYFVMRDLMLQMDDVVNKTNHFSDRIQAIANQFSHVVEIFGFKDFSLAERSIVFEWLYEHYGKEASVGQTTVGGLRRLTIMKEGRWAFGSNKFYFRDKDDAMRFKLSCA